MKKLLVFALAILMLASCTVSEKREDNLVPNDGKELTHPYPPEDI